MKTADDFFEVWGNISGRQSTLGLMLTTGYFERGVPPSSPAAVLSRNAAGSTSPGRGG